MKLHEILANPAIMAEVRRRACGDLRMPLGPPVMLPSIESKYPQVQRRNTEPATQAQQEHAQGRGDAKERR